MRKPELFVILFALIAGAVSFARAQTPAPPPINFADPAAVIALTDRLTPYQGTAEKDGSSWYMVTVTNDSTHPAIRVLQASEPAGVGLNIFPRATRPAILQVASSDAAVMVEQVSAYGRRAFRAILPPSMSVSLAVRVANADSPPSLLAWTEPALASFNRQMAIFIAAVAGLISAAMLITAGIAVMTGHAAPRWAALAMALILMTRLAATGMFDASLATGVGGPYGLTAMFAGLALAAGIKLTDEIVPLQNTRYAMWLRYGLLALVALSLAAYLGLPIVALLVNAAVIIGAALVSVYLVLRARAGVKAARVAAPATVIFALVCVCTMVTMLTGAENALTASAVIGGFTAAGTVLLALAVAAGEGITVLSLPHLAAHALHLRHAHPAEPLRAANPPAQPLPMSDQILDAINASHQSIFELDFERNLLKISPSIAALIGMPDWADSLRHADWLAHLHPDDRKIYQQALNDYRAHPGIAFRIEFRIQSESGRTPWFELRATMIGDKGLAARCLGLMADVTMRKEAEAALADRTLRDPLTGLGNRVALMEELDQLGLAFKSATFALLDIDRFKSIHASLGDEGGDDLLLKIADRLKARFKDTAEIFRVGGDCFAILFSKLRGGPDVIGAELVEVCNAPFEQNGRNIFALASVGVTMGNEAKDPLDLLKNAELALHQAKRQGGGCARAYSRDLEAMIPNDAVALETDLRRAIENNELDLYYQPIVALEGGTVAGFEALMRWHHPSKGMVTPDDFIAHSEETGLITALGRFALERAVGDLAHWQKYFPLRHPLFVSVNLSRRQLQERNFETYLAGLIRNSGLAPGSLKLEVTETILASDSEIRGRLTRIRELGAGLSIDDFGTGASSLSRLKDIPFDTIKIDRSFIAPNGGLQANADTGVVLSSIISLANDLGRTVVVEGIENERDALSIKEMGCAYGQGYYFSAALTAQEALNFIARHYNVGDAAALGPAGLS